jgi:hypothetical protein
VCGFARQFLCDECHGGIELVEGTPSPSSVSLFREAKFLST